MKKRFLNAPPNTSSGFEKLARTAVFTLIALTSGKAVAQDDATGGKSSVEPASPPTVTGTPAEIPSPTALSSVAAPAISAAPPVETTTPTPLPSASAEISPMPTATANPIPRIELQDWIFRRALIELNLYKKFVEQGQGLTPKEAEDHKKKMTEIRNESVRQKAVEERVKNKIPLPQKPATPPVSVPVPPQPAPQFDMFDAGTPDGPTIVSSFDSPEPDRPTIQETPETDRIHKILLAGLTGVFIGAGAMYGLGRRNRKELEKTRDEIIVAITELLAGSELNIPRPTSRSSEVDIHDRATIEAIEQIRIPKSPRVPTFSSDVPLPTGPDTAVQQALDIASGRKLMSPIPLGAGKPTGGDESEK